MTTYADVAQLVEHWLPKPGVAGSSPVVRFGVDRPDHRQMQTFRHLLDSHEEEAARMLDSYLARSSALLTNAATSLSDGA